MRRKTVRIILVVILASLIAVAAYAYFSFGWMFTVKPRQGIDNLNLPLLPVAGSQAGEIGFTDGSGNGVLMNKPIRLASLDDTTLVFADINNHAIRTICYNGRVRTLAGGKDKKGYRDGTQEEAQFDSPHGVAVRQDGAIAVAEAVNNTIRILIPGAPDSEGLIHYTVTTMAGIPGKKGMRDGPNHDALFNAPHAVAWGSGGELYVVDIGNSRIRLVRDGFTTTIAGRDKKGKEDGDLEKGTLKYPMDISLDASGNLWIIDAGTMIVRKWNRETGLTTPFPGLELAMPHGICILGDRSVVIAELYGHRILRVDQGTGQLTVLCGTTEKGIGNGRLYKPAAVLVHQQTIWIADMGNHRIVRTSLPE